MIKIGSLALEGRAVLAPMAGVTDRAFRELCARYGASMVTTEMVSAKALEFDDKKSWELMQLGETERPAAIQIFGSDPVVMARAAEKAMRLSPNAIDINMGCPAPKIANNGSGSALMKNPALCGAITAEVCRAAPVPVTVKIRKGWDEASVNAVEVAKICEQAGAAAVCVHGRTRTQMYAPPADWDIIRQVKQAVRIPVIGNGDADSLPAAVRLLTETGCDLVMVGRGALGNPWLFQQINAYLTDACRILPGPGIYERMLVMLRHMDAMCTYKGERRAMNEARKHVGWYLKGIRGAASFRRQAGTLETREDLARLVQAVLEASASEQSQEAERLED